MKVNSREVPAAIDALGAVAAPKEPIPPRGVQELLSPTEAKLRLAKEEAAGAAARLRAFEVAEEGQARQNEG